jgi:serine/threonine protein kinase
MELRDLEKNYNQKKIPKSKKTKPIPEVKLPAPSYKPMPTEASHRLNQIDLPDLGQRDFLFPYEEIKQVKELGRGAFGVVFKGVWRSTPVAVKKMQFNEETNDEASIQSFKHEVSLMIKMKPHPNVVSVSKLFSLPKSYILFSF